MTEEKTRVLLVEDSAADARLLQELLSEVPRQPFLVTTAGTLREAIASVSGHDVVLLDLSLPDAHGVDTVSQNSSILGQADVGGVVLDQQDLDRLRAGHEGLLEIRDAAGMVNQIVDPCPGVDSTQTRPPWRSTIFLAIARPMPVPG